MSRRPGGVTAPPGGEPGRSVRMGAAKAASMRVPIVLTTAENHDVTSTAKTPKGGSSSGACGA